MSNIATNKALCMAVGWFLMYKSMVKVWTEHVDFVCSAKDLTVTVFYLLLAMNMGNVQTSDS